jgi:predicted HicB family RNase H-like nuclease
MDKHLNDSYKLRIPAELKARIAESAKAHNRSMNADIVARLEKSFEEQAVASGMSLDDYKKMTQEMLNESMTAFFKIQSRDTEFKLRQIIDEQAQVIENLSVHDNFL